MGDTERDLLSSPLLWRSIEKRIEKYEERMIFQWIHFEEMQQKRFELMERRIFEKIEKELGRSKEVMGKKSIPIRTEEDIKKDKEIERIHRERIETNPQKRAKIGE